LRRRFYRIEGLVAPPPGLPRPQPAYVFDATGRLIDWTGESRSDANFSALWNESQPLPLARFLARFPPN
jgi:hypothetical protein